MWEPPMIGCVLSIYQQKMHLHLQQQLYGDDSMNYACCQASKLPANYL